MRQSAGWGWPIAVLAAAALCLPALGQRVLYHVDEVRYVLLAQGMVEGGSWWVPHLDDEVHREKPPLFMWAIALGSLLGGKVTEWTASLPAALSGIGGVAGTVILGRRLFGARAGFLAGLILATSPRYFWHARVPLADMTVTLFVLLSAWAFWEAMDAPQRPRRPMALFYLFVGLAVSAKGPAGLMPILAVGAFLLVEEGGHGLRTLRPVMGLGILALVSAPWAIPFALQGGPSYVQSVILADYVWWAVGRWQRPADVLIGLEPFVFGMLPWGLLVPLAVREGDGRAPDAGTRQKFRFLLCWVLTDLIVITLMANKKPRYLLPMYPAAALMVGWVWDQWAAGRIRLRARLAGWVPAGVGALAALILVLPLPLTPYLAVFVPSRLDQTLTLAALFVGGGMLAGMALRAGRILPGFAVLWLTMGALLLYHQTKVVIPHYNRLYDVKGFAARISARAGPPAGLVAFRHPLHPAYRLYLGRAVPDIRNPAELVSLLHERCPVYVLAHEPGWRQFQEASGKTWPVVDRAEIAGVTELLGTNAGTASCPARVDPSRVEPGWTSSIQTQPAIRPLFPA